MVLYTTVNFFSKVSNSTLKIKSLKMYTKFLIIDNELDLQGLPWHMISADLKNNFHVNISDEIMKFSWKGPGKTAHFFLFLCSLLWKYGK